MAKYATGVGVLSKAAEDIRAEKLRANGIQAQLNDIVEGMEAYWKGQAKAVFLQVGMQFDEHCRKTLEALEEIAAQLSGTAVNYQIQEQQSEQRASGLAARLG